MIAQVFLDNPQNYPEINHKDGIKFNNFVGTAMENYKDGNIEWCNRKMNMIHASENGLINKTSEKRKNQCRINAKKSIEKQKKKIICLDKENNIVKVFNSIKESAVFIKQSSSTNISRALNNPERNLFPAGYKWEYYDEDEKKEKEKEKEKTIKGKKVSCYTKEGEFVKTFNNSKEAVDFLGHKNSSEIRRAIISKDKKFFPGGYVWKYEK